VIRRALTVLLEYMDSVPAPDLSGELAEVVARIESLPISADNTKQQRKLRLIASLQKIIEVRQQAYCFTQAIRNLQAKVVEHLERREELAPAAAGGPDENVDSVEDTEQELPEEKRTRKKKERQTDQAIQPSAALDEWAIGLDENNCWQIFRKFRSKWCHDGPLKVAPMKREWEILKAFAEHRGALTAVELINLVRENCSREEGARIYKKRMIPSVSRLRKRLRNKCHLGNKDPIPEEERPKGYRLLITVGHSEKDEHGRPQFLPTRGS
jgi:hypothetical protein